MCINRQYETASGVLKGRMYLEAISKLGFSIEISRQRTAGQEREAEDQPAPSVTGSSTRILQYVEDLRQGLNADTCPPPVDRTKRLF
jgi:hypothetical protein